ncbi:hypothetical protein HY993_01670 [Candidatus Micrarchaeota archaeon]|nr:hypothetical protein [Candidatus Micrarchaeota archaeon]
MTNNEIKKIAVKLPVPDGYIEKCLVSKPLPKNTIPIIPRTNQDNSKKR